jgi:cobalt/nickel transport system permease protein
MIDLFSDIVACRDNALTRLDPRTKLLAALGAVFADLLSTQPWLPLALLLFSVATVLALRLPARLLLWRMVAPLGIVLVLVLVKSLLTGSTPLWVLTAGEWHVTIWLEGALEGLCLGLRVLGAAGIIVLLGAVTPAHQVFHALRWLRFPATWVEIAVLMYRYTFILLDEAEDVAQAQRVRLGYANPRRALSSAGALAGMVLVRSLDQSARTYDAMRLRLYRGQLPFGPFTPLRARDALVLLTALFVLAAAFVLFERVLP